MAGIEDVTPHISLEGADELIAKLKEISDAAVTSFAKVGDAADAMGGAGDGIERMAETGKRSLSELGTIGAEAFSKILESATHGDFTGLITKMFGEVAGSVAKAVESLTGFVDAQAHVMETLSNLAEATGMTSAEILGMREAFASVGISTQAFERSIGRLATAIQSEWGDIQKSVRTSTDDQKSAMNSVAEAALNMDKAYHSLDFAMSDAVREQEHDAQAILSAAQNLRKATDELNDAALKSQKNANTLAGAQLSLEEAEMKLAKDSGQAVDPRKEQALKLDKDRLAVSNAQLAIQEALNKTTREGQEREVLENNVAKARQEKADAQAKAIEDSIKQDDKLRNAHLEVAKAEVAKSEAAEKAHDADLKNIPAIAREIDAVANKQKDWTEVVNGTEISAKNLQKAIILAASAGSGEAPKTQEVIKETSKLFEGMGDSAEAMAKKLEITQQLMGAGFRAGGASAAQFLAVLQRGPEATQAWIVKMQAFSDSIQLDKSTANLKTFNSTFSQLTSTLDIVMSKLAGVMAVPLGSFFKAMDESITSADGTLNHIIVDFGIFVEKTSTMLSGLGALIGKLVDPAWKIFSELIGMIFKAWGDMADAIGKTAQALADMMGKDVNAFLKGMVPPLTAIAIASTSMGAAFGKMLAVLVALPTLIGLVIDALGGLIRVAGRLREILPTWLGGGATEDTAALIKKGEDIEAYGQKVLRTMAKIATGGHLDDKDIDKAGVLGDSSKNKILKDDDKSAQMNKDAATLNKQSAADFKEAVETEKRQAGNTHGGSQGEDVFAPLKPIADNLNKSAQTLDQSADATDKSATATTTAAGDTKSSAAAGKASADATNKAATATDAVAVKSDKVVDKWDLVAKALDEAVKGLVIDLGKLFGDKSPGSTAGKAAGGYISGPGTPTSDSIPAWLSDGEYVMQASSVARYGKSFMDSVNKGVAKFADGGWVDSKFINSLEDQGQAYRGQASVSGGEASSHEEQAEFTLDTGNEGPVMINKTLAERAGIKATGKVTLSGVSGGAEFETGQGEVGIQGIKRMTPITIAPDGGPPNLIGMPWLNMLQDFAISKKTFLLEAATGGHIRGPGTGTSDSIPARLSDGEYVMRSAAVSQYGVPLFDALNSLALGGFAEGGMVGRASRATVPGITPQSPSTILNLSIDGNRFDGLRAPEHVAAKLKTYAVSRQSSRAQTMPSWMA